MSRSTERALDNSIQYGAVFAEVSSPFGTNQRDIDILKFDPIARAVFGFASVTFKVRAHYYWCIGSSDNAWPFSS